jgi:antitoxin (DNA-binding transcriptional repressor) of toxin-antitoxin stability system
VKTIEIGAFEAKTQFSRLLRDVAAGTVVHIRRRGEWVADLVQPGASRERKESALQALDRIASRRGDMAVDEIIELREAGRER